MFRLKTKASGLWGRFHGGYIRARRARVIAGHLADHIPHGASILDIGCGDGRISDEIMRLRPDVQIQGIEVLVPQKTYIPVRHFDGIQVPAGECSYDAVLLVDVLHHSEDAEALLSQARQVANRLIIKDVVNDGFLADFTLRVMDLLGNERLGVACPFNFWPRQRWLDSFSKLCLTVCSWESRIGLYPWPAGLFFERSMHFIASLSSESSGLPDQPGLMQRI